jgi:hypothetical protein
MNKFRKNALWYFIVHDHPSLFLVGTLCLVVISLVLFSWYNATPRNALGASQTKGSFSSPTPDAKGYPVKVYFPKRPRSYDHYEVFPIQRLSPSTKAVATYALQLLIAGPTLEEQKAGYYSDLNGMLQGPSKCGGDYGGPDFQLTLDKRGKFVEAGTATVQFCRQIISIATLPDGIVRDQIGKTLEQFPAIKKVLILRMDGTCFQAESLVGKYCESYQPG